jgi:oligopeptide/dipeptide ABC transporter ATP-binding protein
MALVNEPDLLILDEPTTALDATVQAQILDLIADVRTRVNTSVLLISHDIGVVMQVCSNLIVMYGGKIMECGDTAQIVSRPKHPYTVGLLNSLPSPELKGQRLKAIPGTVPSPAHMPPGCPFASRCDQAMDVCSKAPPLKTIDGGRQVACWLY